MRSLGGRLFIVISVISIARCSVISKPTGDQPLSSTITRTREIPAGTTTSAIPLTPSSIPTSVASPIPSRIAVCEMAYGEVVSGEYQSVVLPEVIPLRIFLPPCYDRDNRRYPTLYVLHGFPFDESHWDDLGIDDRAEARILMDTMEPFIIVMPFQPDPLFTSTDGGPGSYEVEMVEGVIPYVDRTYRTDAQRQARALAGISRGGVWALEIAFRHPDVFNTVAALSPALHVNYPRPPYDPFAIAQKEQLLPTNIFLSAGTQEPSFRAATESLSSTLDELGVDHTLIIRDGGHDDEAWRKILPALLDFIGAAWSEN